MLGLGGVSTLPFSHHRANAPTLGMSNRTITGAYHCGHVFNTHGSRRDRDILFGRAYSKVFIAPMQTDAVLVSVHAVSHRLTKACSVITC